MKTYVYVDWMSCKCGNTKCLFLRIWVKKKPYVIKKCRQCYLEDCRNNQNLHKKQRTKTRKLWVKNNLERIKAYRRRWNKKHIRIKKRTQYLEESK